MKRIIYSIYTNNIDVESSHSSSTDYKKSQFEKWKDHIEANHKKYAFLCDADYHLHTTKTTSYHQIQFEKLLLLEHYSKNYDEMLYIDFDVVSHTTVNFFEYHNMNNLLAHGLCREPHEHEFKKMLKRGRQAHEQAVFTKTCAKNAMLSLENINGNNILINTGVVGCNKNIVEQIMLSDRLNSLHSLMDEAKNNNLYPIELSNGFFYNNEVYLSFLVERFNIPYIDIAMPWNFILDGYCSRPSAAAHLVHHVNKEFEISFDAK